MAEDVSRYPSRIDEWIKRRGYTLYEVERGTQIPQRTLNNYRKGRTQIPLYRLEKLAQFLERPVSQLEDKQPVGPSKSFGQALEAYSSGGDQTNSPQLMESRGILKPDENLPTPLGYLMTSPLPVSSLLHHEEMLALSAVQLPICWRLYFDGYLTQVQSVLFPLLAHLLPIVDEVRYRERAACWLSKAFQLAALIEMHHHNLGNALAYAKQGVLYGEQANDPNLCIASLIQQANIL